MTKNHVKSPLLFFLIILLVSLSAIGYIYFRNYTPTVDITWVEASVGVKTDWGACSPIPCYETYLLNSEGHVFYNGEQRGSLSSGRTKEIIGKAYSLYHTNTCTPFYKSDATQSYEVVIDGTTYEFGNPAGCEEMQGIISAFDKSITI